MSKLTTAKNYVGYYINLSTLRKFILFILFISFFTVAFNQVIKGTIVDKQTDSTICFASVYFSRTFTGTTSDQNGDFELDISNNASRPLTISAMGYYSMTLTDFFTDEPLIIYLTPKAYELKEVIIIGRSLVRERKTNLKLFKEEFLGKTANARKCEIVNENEITFNYGSDNDTLKTYASKTILIINNALGYKITYYLDEFKFNKKSKTIFFFRKDYLQRGFNNRRNI